MLGTWGCCPFPNAVQCDSGYTCCPEGTKCANKGGGYNVVSTCVSASATDAQVTAALADVPQYPYVVGSGAPNITGDEVCKTGPPLPYSTTQPNILIIGDSVSIGYTPHVASIMADKAFVQHSPWGGDGGAEETLYGARCIENLIRAPDGTPLAPEVLMFNWGLHNSLAGNCTPPCVPGQSGPPAEYAPYLKKIVASLQSAPALAKTKLLFGITTPMLCVAKTDALQSTLNKQAVAIMAAAGIPTVDLYAAIVGKCGPVPQHSCFGTAGDFCPHDISKTGAGYTWLANSTIVPALAKLL